MRKATIFFPMEDISEYIHCIFEGEKSLILKSLPHADIQHVGGTSISGSITKKELDIQIRVEPGKFEETILFFKKSSHKPHHKELWTETFFIMTGEINRIPIDYIITVINSKEDHYFKSRDYLRNNKEALNKYNNLKLLYAGKPYNDYRKAKQKFFCEMEK
ncbi:MAG: GrpB family protein [Minisyncoccia bacterium]